MHNTLEHALGQGTQGPGTKPGARMHKSVVHAQESCACTRILTNKTPVLGQYVPPAFLFQEKRRPLINKTLVLGQYVPPAVCFMKKDV